ncbi:MAG: hypothetical protein RSD77_09845 [Romboutsia sp.]
MDITKINVEELRRNYKKSMKAIEAPFIKAQKEREKKEIKNNMKNELEKVRKILGDKPWLLKEDEKFDINNQEHQYKYIAYSLYNMNTYVKEYDKAIKDLNNSNKYSQTYKQEKRKELRKELFEKKNKELFNVKARLNKVRVHLEVEDEANKDEKNPTLALLEKMYLTQLIEKGLKYKDKTFIQSLLPQVAKDKDLVQIFKNEAGADVENVALNIAIDKEVSKLNEKYTYLDNLEKVVDTMKNFKDTIFTSLEPTLELRRCQQKIVKEY